MTTHHLFRFADFLFCSERLTCRVRNEVEVRGVVVQPSLLLHLYLNNDHLLGDHLIPADRKRKRKLLHQLGYPPEIRIHGRR